jgi:hypothetical protein
VQVLPQRNKLQASPFFTHIPNYARQAATVRMPWNKTVNTPVFTGLPPHVSILTKIEELKEALKTATDAILGGVKEDLDGRRLGSESYFVKEEIVAEIKLLHADMTQRMETIARSSFSYALQVPHVQQGGIEVAVGGLGEDTQLPSDSTVTLFDRGTGHRFQYFCSAGGIRRLPENFVFPKMSLVTLITSWFSGNESMRTVPYKQLRATDIVKVRERSKLSQMKKLMLAVEIAARHLGTWDDLAQGQKGAWDVGSTVRLYESVQHCFDYRSATMVRRKAQISWHTVYNLFNANKGKFAIDLQ